MFSTGTKQLNANMLTPLQNDIFDMFSQTVEYIIESCCIVSEKKDKDKDETHFINHHSQTQFHMLPVMKKQHGMQSEQISYIF